MNFPVPFLTPSDSETPAIPVALTKIPIVAQVSGHMMISYDNPVEWGTEEEVLQINSAQRTPWAGKKESGWSGVEYFKIVNSETNEEEVRLLAIPGSWSRSPNSTVEKFTEALLQNEELPKNIAHGLVTHPKLAWEKSVSNRDPHRIVKSLLFRSILIQTRTLPSNAQLNHFTLEILQNEDLKTKTLEAKKQAEPTEPLLVTLPQKPENPITSSPTSTNTEPVSEETPSQGFGAEAPNPLPEEEPKEEIPTKKKVLIIGPQRNTDPEILEIAKRVLPASRILQARGTVEDAAQDAADTAAALLNLLR